MNDDIAMSAPVDPAVVGPCVDEVEAARADRADNMPIEPERDVEEWLADEAGYGYGV